MPKLTTLVLFLSTLSACASFDLPPCDNPACAQAQIQMMQAFMGNLQRNNAMVQQSLMNTQNNLALIAAGSHLEVPHYEPVPFQPFQLRLMGE